MKKVVCMVMMLFALSILVVPAVLAMNTNIHINTLKDHRISIIVRETGKLTSLESFHKDTGDGTLNLVTSSSADSLDLLVTLRKDGNDILNEKFTDNPAGFPVYINFIPGEVSISDKDPDAVTETANKTETNEAETVVETTDTNVESEESNDETAPITGQAILGDGKYSKTLVYGGIVVIVLVVLFLMFMFTKSGKKDEKIKVTKYSEMSRRDEDADLADAEQKLKEAQAEIEKLKHKRSELSEAEQEYQRAKEKLERIKQGRED